MKTSKSTKTTALLFIPAVIMIIFISCNKEEEYFYDALAPVYMDFEDFRQPPKFSSAKQIRHSGKIYFKDNLIFINEPNEGIHIIDNSYPSSPQKIGFYEILGNVDMAIRGNILFADSYIDLLALDISNIMEPIEVGRIENAFPDVLPLSTNPDLPFAWNEIDRNKGVIVGWKETRVKTTYYTGWFWRGETDMNFANEGNNAAGVAGSMARFMLNDQYLHSVAQPWVLKTIDVSTPSNMQQTDSIYTWREMETLFRYNNHLFVGTTTGMVIYSLANL